MAYRKFEVEDIVEVLCDRIAELKEKKEKIVFDLTQEIHRLNNEIVDNANMAAAYEDGANELIQAQVAEIAALKQKLVLCCGTDDQDKNRSWDNGGKDVWPNLSNGQDRRAVESRFSTPFIVKD